jgi:hypothetical protein
MKKILLLMAVLGLGLTSCEKNIERNDDEDVNGGKVDIGNEGVEENKGNDDANGMCPETVVITPTELCIDLATDNCAKFTTNEPSYLWATYILGENLELQQNDILGWRESDGAILVWSSKGAINELPFEISSDWYTIRQTDEISYEVTIGEVDEERLISLMIGSRVKSREPALIDITIKPKK